MKLTLLERLNLLNIMPEEGDLRTMRTIHRLRMDLAPTEQDVKAWEIVSEGNQIHWNAKKDTTAEIQVGELGREIILERFKELDSQKKITLQMIPLYERFLE